MNNLLDLIKPYANEKKKIWWENYVKHNSLFLGVPMADLRQVLKKWCVENSISTEEKEELVLELFSGCYAEEKLLGILMMSEHMTRVSNNRILSLVERIFEKELITDWNICDWLCVKVLTPRLEMDDFSKRLFEWSKSENLWFRRAALVPFASLKQHKVYESVIFKISKELIVSDQRFSKTAVGWVLREMMPYHKDVVLEFCRVHIDFMSNEVLNNILKHQEDKKRIKQMLKGNI